MKKWWAAEFAKNNKAKDEQGENPELPKKYKYDYLAALIMHSISWKFMIMLPIAVVYEFCPPAAFFILFGANVIIHTIVNDLKANRQKINLITDQAIHIA